MFFLLPSLQLEQLSEGNPFGGNGLPGGRNELLPGALPHRLLT